MPTAFTGYTGDTRYTTTDAGPQPGGANFSALFDLARRLYSVAPQGVAGTTISPRRPTVGVEPRRSGFSMVRTRPPANAGMMGGRTGPQESMAPSAEYVPLFTEAIPGMYGSSGGYTSPSLARKGANTVAAGWVPRSLASQYAIPESAQLIPDGDGSSQGLKQIIAQLLRGQQRG